MDWFFLFYALFALLFAYVAIMTLWQEVMNGNALHFGWLLFVLGGLLSGSLGLYLFWHWLPTLFYRRPVLILDGKGITVRHSFAALLPRNREWQKAWCDIERITLIKKLGTGYWLPPIYHLCVQSKGEAWKIGVYSMKGGTHAAYHTVLLYHAAHTKPAQSWVERLTAELEGLSPEERAVKIEQALKNRP